MRKFDYDSLQNELQITIYVYDYMNTVRHLIEISQSVLLRPAGLTSMSIL